MAKKYLLYIHNPLFDKETKKSQLVNDLLEKHYSNENPKVIKTKNDAEKAVEQITYKKTQSWGA